LLAIYKEYICQSSCNPAVYRALGLEHGLQLRTEVFASEKRKEVLKPWSDDLAEYFSTIEL